MALEKISLKDKQIVLTEVSYTTSNITLLGSNYLYGEINKVNDLCDNYNAGDLVIYDSSDSISIVVEGSAYSVITEDKIKLKEL